MGDDKNTVNGSRRSFVKVVAAITAAMAALLTPIISGLFVILQPLRKKDETSKAVRIAFLETLPADGTPVKFSVLANKTDAWNKFPESPVGAVYLRKTSEKTVEAFNVACPHAGCFVSFVAEKQGYFCPCHNSTFALDGKVDNPQSPSPRGLDSLTVEIRKGREIWIQFQQFQPGVSEKIPVS
ncbi:MAG: (2Fe-2S)-binding protein [Verrucomicrobiales bacterium]|nr:(2Fe-2S)-binding protein [Verrucomicrobiales bacterium]